MTERAPTGQSTLEKERAKLDKQRAKLEHQDDVLRREEAFGKYDEDVTPAEGEVTYEQYLEQRPSEPGKITRTGDRFYNHEAKKTASYNDYYMDTVFKDHIEEVRKVEGPYEAPKYDEMTISELAQAANDAQELGDRAAIEEAREEAQERFTMEIINEGNDEESSEAAQERFDKAMAHYDALVESTVLYNGEKVVAGEVFESPSGKKVVEIVDADGKEHLVREADLQYKAGALAPVEVPVSEPKLDDLVDLSSLDAPEAQHDLAHLAVSVPEQSSVDVVVEGKPVTRVSVLPSKPAPVASTPVEPTPQAEQAIESQEKEDTKQVSGVEKIKGWFNKKGGLREMLGMHYWEKRWNTRQQQEDPVLDHDVVATDTPEKKEAKRKVSRYVLIAGAATLAVGAALAAGTIIANTVKNNEVHEPAPATVVSTAHFSEVAPVEAEVPPAQAPEAAIPPEVFTIPSGGGGEQLFNTAGIDPSVWYNNEAALLAQFPNDFYQMSDGHVGIAHPGPLSQGAQDYIQNLR